MKHLLAAVALLLTLAALPAAADVYNLTITMPALSGAAQCKPYMNGTALAVKPCGSAQAYPGAVPSEGTYRFAYAGVSTLGTEGDRNPAEGDTIYVIDKKPETPTSGPTVVITCRDLAGATVTCPPNISITPAP
jgi:hypothetical protein